MKLARNLTIALTMVLFTSAAFAHQTAAEYFDLMFKHYGYDDVEKGRMISLKGIEQFYKDVGTKKPHKAAHATKALLYYMDLVAQSKDANSLAKDLTKFYNTVIGTKINMWVSYLVYDVSQKSLENYDWPDSKRFEQAFNEFNFLRLWTKDSISYPEFEIAKGFARVFLPDEFSLGNVVFMRFAWSLNRHIKWTLLKTSGDLKGNIVRYRWNFGVSVDTLSKKDYMRFMDSGIESIINQLKSDNEED